MSEPADIHADLELGARVETARRAWEGSPSASVWRKPLYRQGGENGPVTSVVRYDAGGSFAPHSHPEGEELLVLAGLFADDQGEYPAGTFLFNPDGSRHAPRSPQGCELLVRLRQSPGPERPRRVVTTSAVPLQAGASVGAKVREIWSERGYPQSTWLVSLAPGFAADAPLDAGGLELFVLHGHVCDEIGEHGPGTWVRWPPQASHRPTSNQGAELFLRYRLAPQPGRRRLVAVAPSALPQSL
jgi:anti-sigma factor ChrR (cupin superfamily)